MQARDIMTAPVVTVPATATIVDAAKLMVQDSFSGLPVVNKAKEIVGVVTEGDLLRRAEIGTELRRSKLATFLTSPGRLAADYVQSYGRTISEIMTKDPVTVRPDASLAEIVELMEIHGIKRLPVVQKKRVIGIVSRANLLRALAKAADKVPAPSEGDRKIRADIHAEMERQDWPGPSIDITVQEGAVILKGTIFDERIRKAMKVLVENIPGVRKVVDQLLWIEPHTGLYLEPPAA